MPPPEPPSVNAGRTMAGSPIDASAWSAARSRSAPVAPPTISEGGGGGAMRPGRAPAPRGRPPRGPARPFQDARPRQRDGEVERRLAPETRQDPVRALALEDALHRLDRERLPVDHVGDAGVGHDRGRVRVQQDRADALAAQGPAGLRAGVVEIGRLPDDHGPGADDEDGRRPGMSTAHPDRSCTRATKRSKTSSASSGPGEPSGWYCTVSMGSSRWRRPSTDPSLRLRCETKKPLATGSVSATTWT